MDDTAMNTIVAEFGCEVAQKLRTEEGSPEDHLRTPSERMLSAIGASLGLTITAIGETRLPDLSIRPDYAVDVAGARVGYAETPRPAASGCSATPTGAARGRHR